MDTTIFFAANMWFHMILAAPAHSSHAIISNVTIIWRTLSRIHFSLFVLRAHQFAQAPPAPSIVLPFVWGPAASLDKRLAAPSHGHPENCRRVPHRQRLSTGSTPPPPFSEKKIIIFKKKKKPVWSNIPTNNREFRTDRAFAAVSRWTKGACYVTASGGCSLESLPFPFSNDSLGGTAHL